ncbi:PIN domain-containing protein [bacterium]|nr:PIN domain-containing protein [candidate division CSSED10-310 bacterium]
MRFLIDSTILIAAAIVETDFHEPAHTLVTTVLAEDDPWCLAWVNIYEFMRVTTHHKIFPRPLTFQQAFDQMRVLLDHPACEILSETPRHASMLHRVAAQVRPVAGNFVHDCHIAALLFEHDVHAIVIYDSHFRRFGPDIEVWSPEEALAKLGERS